MMEAAKIDDTAKLTNMVMCGDHPSFTKTKLNMKEINPDEKEKPKERIPLFYSKISPTTSGIQRNERAERELRAVDAVLLHRPDIDIAVHRNRALVQAAVGSFHWPPYLVAVWVLVLLLTHLLHCIVNMLERALPNLRHLCGYFRSWTEESWRAEREGSARVCSAGLACITGLLYTIYFVLYGLHAIALWSVDPLCLDTAGGPTEQRSEPKITNYEDETITTKTT